MTWTTFFAAPDDFGPLLETMLAVDGARLYEVYSRLGHPARHCSDPDEAVRTFQLGVDSSGQGVAAHCALWIPTVMPEPSRRRIELTSGSWRESVEGCGLFWLQAGGIHEQCVTESVLGWFTEGAARQRCDSQPGHDAVDWEAHTSAAKALRASLRRLAKAHARRFPVLAQAAHLHQNGYRLLYGPGIKREVSVGAA